MFIVKDESSENNKIIHLMALGMVEQLEQEEKKIVYECVDKIKDMVKEHDDLALLALTIVATDEL